MRIIIRKNDPAAGSPTATLLRLLLPLLKKYRWTSRQTKRPISPTTCIAPSSETTTGGVYKWQGRNRHSLMSCAYETFLVARPIIAILGPKWVDVIPVIPPSFETSGSDQMVGILVLTDIVVRVSPRTLRSITDLLLPKISPDAKPGILQRRNPQKVPLRPGKPKQQGLLSFV
jgi:hypothetical protein